MEPEGNQEQLIPSRSFFSASEFVFRAFLFRAGQHRFIRIELDLAHPGGG
jgi:hypothetical protein